MTPLLPAALLLAHVALAAPVWPEVDLPRAPTRLPGVAHPAISLNDTSGDGTLKKQPVRNAGKKVGRNDPCPCGSGKKYKKCCGMHEDD